MDSVAVTVPLRQPTKKMKKRKELDALAPPHAVSRRTSGKRSSQELLSDSSDERSEYWNVSTRSSRKCRGRSNRTCPGLLKACSAFLACASVLATASLIWLFIDVRQQLTALRTELDQVIAGSEGVPDALQKCHSMSRDLQNNQTLIFSHLSDLKLQINNFTIQLTNIQHGLHQVQEWVRAAPELANVPKDLNALSTTVVSLGSQISDLGNTVTNLKEVNLRLQDVQKTVQQNVSDIQHSMLEFMNVTQRPQTLSINETRAKTDELNAAIAQLTKSVTSINTTLFTRLNWTNQDQKNDHMKLETLREVVQNVSSRVMSLEGEYNNIFEQITVLPSLTNQTTQLRMAHTELNEKLKRLEQSSRNSGVENSSRNTAILNAINKMQDQKDSTNKEKNFKTVLDDVITESYFEPNDVSRKELQRVSTNARV